MAKHRFTPTQQLILTLLSDGMPHPREDVMSCLADPLSSRANLNNQLSDMRRLLRPRGEDIICQLLNRRICYRHVRLLASAYDGKQ
jgi:DNA-binding SARP family transcriptional activator